MEGNDGRVGENSQLLSLPTKDDLLSMVYSSFSLPDHFREHILASK